jgi:hypothetical protein
MARPRIIGYVTASRALFVCLLFIGPLAAHAVENGDAPADVLRTLRAAHPRLLVLDDDLARVKQAIAADPTAKAYFDQLNTSAQKLLNEPVSQRVLVGPRLLGVSRAVLTRVQILAGLYRLSGEKRYARRAADEMLAAADFVDWHPAHFLDTTEMTNALAIGYDWLFDVLSADERAAIRAAIVEKGLKPGLAVYASGKGFAINTNNWNQVCNGGMTMGALAVADEEPEIARQILEKARASIPRAMKLFNPDGGCEEGPGYWAYATDYTVYYLAGLQTALGTDFGFLKTPGLSDTGLFRIHSIGPLGKTFNYADAGEGVTPGPQMFWLARTFDRPLYAYHERQRIRAGMFVTAQGTAIPAPITPMHLFFFNAPGDEADLKNLPTAAMFRRVNVAFFRTAWNDRNAAYVGFKGGDNTFSHGHLDLGSFVYDADGVRWANDLGPDDYNLPGYFGAQRWTYYRLRTEGQNTITLNGENQARTAKAPLVAFSRDHAYAVANLTAGYPMAQRVMRGVRLVGKQLLVQDEIEAGEPVEFTWHMHTPAKITIESSMRSATLRQGNRELTAQILQPAAARFAIAAADPPPPVEPNPPMRARGPRDSQKLVVRLSQPTKDLRLLVLLTPRSEDATRVPAEPLEKWIDASPATRPSHTPATRP